jgi:hypothetical protein
MAKDQLIYGLRPILQALQDNQTLGNVFLQKGIGGALYTQLGGRAACCWHRTEICTRGKAESPDSWKPPRRCGLSQPY